MTLLGVRMTSRFLSRLTIYFFLIFNVLNVTGTLFFVLLTIPLLCDMKYDFSLSLKRTPRNTFLQLYVYLVRVGLMVSGENSLLLKKQSLGM